MAGFSEQNFNFSLSHQNLIKTIFSNIFLVRKGLNQQKMARDIDFRAPDGRESLRTAGEKTGFSGVHCEVPEQPIWIFLFEGFNLGHGSSPSTFEVFGTRDQ
jgi:hypothetical protein